jgi:hypothetical protein
VTSLSVLGGPNASAFVVFLLGLITVLAGIVLVAELVIRAALIYVVVALAPLVFAARLWPATKGASRKLLELLCALVLSKLVIAVALAGAAAAAVGAGSGGEVTALPEPEVFAEDPGGSVTQAVGILLAASAAFGVAAFSPLLIARLLPMTEAALVAQGVRGGPMRAGHQGMMMANTFQMVSGRRYSQIASGRPGDSVGGGGGSQEAGSGAAAARAGASGASGPAALAAASVITAARATRAATSTGTRATTGAAASATGGSADRSTPTRPQTAGQGATSMQRPSERSSAQQSADTPAPQRPDKHGGVPGAR